MNKLLRGSQLFVKRNASTILTCVGGVGTVATAVLAVKATPKAIALMDEAKKEKGEELTKMEVVKVAGPAYIPAIAVGVSTLACIFGANILNKRQQAALMSAYAFLDNSYKEYKKKVEELYGEDANKIVKESIAKDKYEETDIHVEDNKELFYDEFSERYFESTIDKVIAAQYAVNRKISLWGAAELNEFYEALDIPPVDYGSFIGWSSGTLMDISWTSWLDFEHKKVQIAEDLEATFISMSVDPTYDYEYY